MKRIQNRALAGCSLAMRYTRDESGIPLQAKGDAEGVFELPDKEADMLLSTNGWTLCKPVETPVEVLVKPVAIELSPAPKPKRQPRRKKASKLPPVKETD